MRFAIFFLALTLAAPLRAVDLAEPIGLDAQVVTGRLANGITWFVRENPKPEKRVELRLAIRAGSVLEEENQRGLAHLLEHMAFNGTRDFKKHELIAYLESIGMTFGADLNAFTAFDKTVYMLQVPAEADKLAKAVQILENWAGALLLEEEEIEKERGVVIEEWRLRRGADQRIFDQQFPILFQGSRYAERLPIGTKEVLDTFPPERVREYYRSWYRPDLMAVAAVGDYPADQLRALIEGRFGRLAAPAEPTVLPDFPVPDHAETLFALADDPEATASSVGLLWKRDPDPQLSVGDFRRATLESLFTAMLNQRLDERREMAEAPFLSARAGGGRYVRSKHFFSLTASVKENGHLPGFRALLEEAERVRRHGFTEGELTRARANLHRGLRKAWQERDTTPSSSLVMGLVMHFTDGNAFASPERRLKLFEALAEGMTLAEVNALGPVLMPGRNQVVYADGPRQDGLRLPAREDLAAALAAAGQAEVAPYQDRQRDEPLLAQEPTPGTVVERVTIDVLGLTRLRLSNGAQVWVKPTDFKQDEVLFSAFSQGGTSLASEADLIAADSAAGLVGQSGAGAFNRVELRNRLSGKVVGLQPYIQELQEGFHGSCSPDDLETLLSLVHLYFTAPRLDPETFQTQQRDWRESLVHRWSEPEAWFSDRMTEVLGGGHPRRRPPRRSDPDRMDAGKSLAFFRERFADPADFTFLLVGSLTVDQAAELSARYLASLPARGGGERWRDPRVRRPSGARSHVVEKGLEPKAQVALLHHGPMEWTYFQRHRLQSLLQVLNIRLREAIREDKSGVYSIRAGASFEPFPQPEYSVTIQFGCDPGRVQELLAGVEAEIEKLRRKPVTGEELAKVQEMQRRKREVDLKTNTFWFSVLQFYLWGGEDPLQVLEFDRMVDSLTAKELQAAARRYFGPDRAVFVLRPQAP
jgi:zinc protease